MNNIIQLEEVLKVYLRGRERLFALRDISLSVEEGDFLVIIGPSGSGKTTLLNLIGCIDRPTKGRIIINGTDVTCLSERGLSKLRARSVGFVFQQFFLLPTLTARENVELPGLFTGLDNRQKKAQELLNIVSLNGRQDHLPSQLSGGEMQRVAIARALINSPKILLADEPTGNLDSQTAGEIYRLFLDLHQNGQTIILVTHNQGLVQASHRLIELKDGCIGERGDNNDY